MCFVVHHSPSSLVRAPEDPSVWSVNFLASFHAFCFPQALTGKGVSLTLVRAASALRVTGSVQEASHELPLIVT